MVDSQQVLFLNFSNRIIMQILNFLNLGIFFFSDIFYKNFCRLLFMVIFTDVM